MKFIKYIIAGGSIMSFMLACKMVEQKRADLRRPKSAVDFPKKPASEPDIDFDDSDSETKIESY